MAKSISQYSAVTTLLSGDNFLLERANVYYNITSANLSTSLLGFGELNDLGDIGALSPTSGQGLVWNGSAWTAGSVGGDFSNGGDTAGANRTLGNNDAYSLGFKTNNIVRIHATSAGLVGISNTGYTSPTTVLDVESSESDAILSLRNSAQAYSNVDFYVKNGASSYVKHAQLSVIMTDTTSSHEVSEAIFYVTADNDPSSFAWYSGQRSGAQRYFHVGDSAYGSGNTIAIFNINGYSSDTGYGAYMYDDSVNDLLGFKLDGQHYLSSSLLIDDSLTLGTANSKSVLELASTTKAFLPVRMTSAQRSAISSPPEGSYVHQTDGADGIYYYDGAAWLQASSKPKFVTGSAGPTLSFDKDYWHGLNGAACTGNISFSTTNLQVGSVVVVIHNDSSEPTYPAAAVKLNGSDTYSNSNDNKIFFIAESSSKVYYIIKTDA